MVVFVGVGLAGCFEAGTSGGSDSDAEPLSVYEEEVVAHWVRFHRYDETYDHFLVRDDRTACFWEVTSSGSHRDARSYAGWFLEETAPGSLRFDVRHQDDAGRGLAVYDYAEDALFWGGYENLRMGHGSFVSECG